MISNNKWDITHLDVYSPYFHYQLSYYYHRCITLLPCKSYYITLVPTLSYKLYCVTSLLHLIALYIIILLPYYECHFILFITVILYLLHQIFAIYYKCYHNTLMYYICYVLTSNIVTTVIYKIYFHA